MERRVRRVFDRNGRSWQRVTFCRAIAADDYDRLCAGPAGGPGAAGSVQRALGDTRTGAQLLAEAAADRRLTLARLRGSQRGRGWLAQLADEVRRRFAGTVRAAREVVAASPAVEAWARRRVEAPWPPDEADDADGLPIGPARHGPPEAGWPPAVCSVPGPAGEACCGRLQVAP